ncbi:MAG: quinolinate synthase NadA [Desulfobacterales bacterium]|nr:quinolinate synthase NadA [Desulfobacterales bacterium]
MQTHYDHKRLMDQIIRIKQELGSELLILTHHYQRKEIVDLGDHRGDSFALARRAARDENARYIVFCGVQFMAESAAVLAKPGQIVQIPDPDAGCWMADMADGFQVEKSWQDMGEVLEEKMPVPVAYVNSHADIKAFCGRNGGAACTSANARAVVEWAFGRGDKVFFLPDEHLGRNTAWDMGIPESEICVWDPALPLGGNTEADIRRARVILWQGHCQVHSQFTPEQVQSLRVNFPDARILVHPECRADVVQVADAAGSTSFIAREVAQAPSGSTLILGTEIHFIKRLAVEYPDKKILPLMDTFCPNMYKVNLPNLLHTLENIGQVNRVDIPDPIRRDAYTALDRMLSL